MMDFGKICFKFKLGMVRIYLHVFYLQQANNFCSLEHQWGLNLTKAILENLHYNKGRK